jgi:hypothetical protein
VNAQEPPPEESSEGNFVEALQHSTKSIKPNIRDGSGLGNLQLEYYIIRLLDLLIPVVISAGVVVVMIGAYKMMSTEKEDAIKEGGRLVIYGVIGIIIMVSAKFIGNTLVDKVIVNNINAAGLQGIQVAESLYDNIMLPFLKILAYLSAGILFFIMAMRVFSFLVSQDEAVKKKAT